MFNKTKKTNDYRSDCSIQLKLLAIVTHAGQNDLNNIYI